MCSCDSDPEGVRQDLPTSRNCRAASSAVVRKFDRVQKDSAAAVRMATAEGIAKLVQKQAGRAKEKVSESKNRLFCHRSICHLIWHSGPIAVAVVGAH